MKWWLYFLVALLISLLPCVIFPELIIPFDQWEAWEWSRNHRRVEYSGTNYPPVLRVALPIFTAIVLPPNWLAETLGYHRTMYGDLASSHAGVNNLGSSFHYSPPAIIAAGEHLVVAVPFWFLIVAAVGQTTSRVRARVRGRRRGRKPLPNSA